MIQQMCWPALQGGEVVA